ncbi:methyl-accepting chemotaxis protein [Vibrio penaeicida]|uniref:methyl-accepting chemotaxis protein n=1 Tax=Vibrio penaeicida TaxID=104609 RepID=UPI0027377BB7|nr:methyl-accepting chemotaxis protein [Vibrio penaeicida]MDP2571747.1 methyl-accepting chemotaxis protein [Vibrio penaeicida]
MQSALYKRAVIIAVIVGSILNLINQFDALLGPADFNVVKALLTYCVPFIVSIVSSKITLKSVEKNMVAPECPEDTAGLVCRDTLSEARGKVQSMRSNAGNVNQASRKRLAFAESVVDQAHEVTSGSCELAKLAEVSQEQIHSVHGNFNLMNKRQTEFMAEFSQASEWADNLKESIDNLSQQFSQIENMASSITSLSDKTNLLALNASIEAARAGEFGRGFAVVAEEVKGLANKSGEDAQRINALMGELSSTSTKLADDAKLFAESMSKMQENTSHEEAEQVAVSIDQIRSAATDVHDRAQWQIAEMEKMAEKVKQLAEDAKAAVDGSANNMELSDSLLTDLQHVVKAS